jgi:hypothetical protein
VKTNKKANKEENKRRTQADFVARFVSEYRTDSVVHIEKVSKKNSKNIVQTVYTY